MKVKQQNSSKFTNQSYEYEDQRCFDDFQKTQYICGKQKNKENCISKFKINSKPLILHKLRSNSPQISEQGQLDNDNEELQKKIIEVLKKSPQMHFAFPTTSRNSKYNIKPSLT